SCPRRSLGLAVLGRHSLVSIVGRAGSRSSRSIFVLVLSGSTFGPAGSSHSSSTFGFFKIFWVGWNVLPEGSPPPINGQPGYWRWYAGSSLHSGGPTNGNASHSSRHSNARAPFTVWNRRSQNPNSLWLPL